MSHEILAFSFPKIGEAEKTIQDKFESSPDRSLAALADGAGSSLYPRQWAKILVQAFCQSPEDPIAKLKQSYQEWLQPAQEEWRKYYLNKLRNPKRRWWQGGSQIKSHGSSTFIGLRLQTLNGSEQSQWQAVAVGDSCLFKLERVTQNLFAFPIKTSQAFKGTTQCFESLPEYPSFPPQFEEGWYMNGDIFLLATDALSQWLLTDYENQGEGWKEMFELKEQNEVFKVIDQLRQQKLIKNDDITGVLIKSPEIVTNCKD
ncbi:MAG: protein phosphatase 2C domain-containing protein [Microcystaceae cyanobacterium]